MKNNKLLMVGVLGLAFGVVSRVEADINFKINNKTSERIEFSAQLRFEDSQGNIRQTAKSVDGLIQHKSASGKVGNIVSGALEKSTLFRTPSFSGTLQAPTGDKRLDEHYNLRVRIIGTDKSFPVYVDYAGVNSVDMTVERTKNQFQLIGQVKLNNGEVKKFKLD